MTERIFTKIVQRLRVWQKIQMGDDLYYDVETKYRVHMNKNGSLHPTIAEMIYGAN